MDINKRVEEYREFLLDVYDDIIVNTFTTRKGTSLEFNDDQIELNKFLIVYEKSRSVCRDCQKVFNDYGVRLRNQNSKLRLDFEQRPMEFPNWLGSLDFKSPHRKDIMIIGQAAGPDIQTNINISYGLGNLSSCIEHNGTMNNEKINLLFKNVEKQLKDYPNFLKLREKIQKTQISVRNNLWERLYDVFDDNLEKVMNMTYLTDLSRCSYKSTDIWRECAINCQKYLFQEIKFINPKLIIFLGSDGYEKVKKSKEFKVEDDKKATEKYKISKNFPKIGTITSHEGDMYIKFVKIYHNQPFRTSRRWNASIHIWKELFRNEIYPVLGFAM